MNAGLRNFPLIAFLALSLCFGRSAAAEYLIKFSHVVSPDTPKGLAVQYFADRVNERMAGRVKVEIYPESQLYDDNKVLMAMRLAAGKTGLMAAPSLSKFTRYSRQLQVFDLPFLFDGVEEIHRLADSPLAQRMVGSLELKGIKGLAFWDNGAKVFSVRGDRPLMSPGADFQGKRFRIQNSDVHLEMIKALGGTPRKLPFKHVRSALAQGVVDGQENTWSNIHSQGFHEVQSHITDSRHSYIGYLVVVSAEFWRQLPDDIRDELSEILVETSLEQRRFAREAEVRDRQAVLASGKVNIVSLDVTERARWKAATSGVEALFAPQIGVDLLKDIHQLLGH